MASTRKTVDVNAIVSDLMQDIKRAKSADEKRGICKSIESILHMSGNYRGFGYNVDSDVFQSYYAQGKGINEMIADGLLTEYDRFYYL